MKLNGKTIGVCEQVVVLPRESGDLIFKFKGVSDYSRFNALVPEPKMKYITKPNGETVPDFSDRDYKNAMARFSKLRIDFLFLETIRGTEGLEFETVNFDDPETWANFQTELENSGLLPAEIGRLMSAITEVNALSEDKIDAATKRFLARQPQAV